MERLKSLFSSHTARVLAQGQWISMLIAGTGIFATILSNAHPNANFPLFMNLFNYLLLSTFLFRKRCMQYWCKDKDDSLRFALDEDDEVPVDVTLTQRAHTTFLDSLLYEHINRPSQSSHSHNGSHNGTTQPSHSGGGAAGLREPAKVNRLLYLLAAILDVEANFLVLLAYNYTSITSVMMLDCFTIPCAMVLSYLFLGCRYTARHIAGTAICLLGLSCIVMNDFLTRRGDLEEQRNTLIGDVLCLSGAVLYAASNVLQETIVKFHDRDAFLGNIGAFGAAIALVQFLCIDYERVRDAHFSVEIVLSMVGFVLCLFFMYINTTSYLQQNDATLFNLSLLTSDVYAVVFSYFFYGDLVGWLYFLAFALVLVGLGLYHSERLPLVVGEESGVTSKVKEIFVSQGESGRCKSLSVISNSNNQYCPIMDESVDRTVI